MTYSWMQMKYKKDLPRSTLYIIQSPHQKIRSTTYIIWKIKMIDIQPLMIWYGEGGTYISINEYIEYLTSNIIPWSWLYIFSKIVVSKHFFISQWMNIYLTMKPTSIIMLSKYPLRPWSYSIIWMNGGRELNESKLIGTLTFK